jgi:hypothetical protein
MPPSESGAAALANSTSSATPLRAKPLLHFKDLGLSTQNRKIKFTSVHASENFLACGCVCLFSLLLLCMWLM